MHPRRIGLLTGGGDCPGLNAVIRAVTKTALLHHNLEVLGIEDGFEGLIENRTHPLTYEAASGILATGGTILGTSNTANPFSYPVRQPDGTLRATDVSAQALATFRANGLDALVCVGGDGTLSIAHGLHQLGLPVVGVPKTIDNDIWGSDQTFGFDTAVGIITDALDRIHSTAMSHHRVMVVEVMGRNAGWLALYAGVAGGADIILLPEIPFNWGAVCEKVTFRGSVGRRFTIVVVAEGAAPAGGSQVVDRVVAGSHEPTRLGGIGKLVSSTIEDRTGIESRVTVLGHLQRGGPPSAADRILCTELGRRAVELIVSGQVGQTLVVREGRITTKPLAAAAGKQRTVPLDHPLLASARAVGTSFGEG
ncbi:MAG: ATP-dependent 6-phosphofructokinase [Bacteroidia bacterium]|nr:ATP-dependent 6-phosphofructokinase [Bacteroidia bacterium]